MTTLFITRGLPGCGKSTWAREWVTEYPQRRAEVNRDAIRMMLHSVAWSGDNDLETQVTVAQHSMIRELLSKGIDVVSSDMNLRQRYVRDLARIARQAGADIEVIDMTAIPLETCILRDKARAAAGDRAVGEAAIKGLYMRYILGFHGKPLPLPTEDETTQDSALVEFDPSLPTVVLCDIDGTVAKMNGRKPYDYTRVSEDLPNMDVIDLVNQVFDNSNGYPVIFMSGREGTEQCRSDTLTWLADHTNVWNLQLLMRPAGDMRKDSIIKRELFDKHIRGRYNVLFVLDDRDQVVRMWREELGLTCLQVAYGNF